MPREQFRPGHLIDGRYRVLKLLGKGGMGEVYLVHDSETDQRLALKTLLSCYLENKRAVHRFIREIHAVRQLDHPGIIKIYEAGRIGSSLYYTMEYVKGKSLRSLLMRRGKLGLGSTVRILSLLCHALEHAHRYTVHRDLSPDNVMVLADGSIKLLDFGLAKLIGAPFTLVGVRVGKVRYSAPEQTRSASEVDLRADIYSIGVMFYELLSGRFPKEGRKLTRLVPGLPKSCDIFVEKATAPDPKDRYATAREVRSELMAIYREATGADKHAVDDSPPPMSHGLSDPTPVPPPEGRGTATRHRLNAWRALLSVRLARWLRR